MANAEDEMSAKMSFLTNFMGKKFRERNDPSEVEDKDLIVIMASGGAWYPGKTVMKKHLEASGLTYCPVAFLPQKRIAFIWSLFGIHGFSDDLKVAEEVLAHAADYLPRISLILNINLISNKFYVLDTFYTYYQEKTWDFHPVSFYATLPPNSDEWQIEKEALFDSKKAWILRPASGSQGEGIQILPSNSSKEDLKNLLDNFFTAWADEQKEQYIIKGSNRQSSIVISEYISNPLLISGGRKFDLRVYCLVAVTNPTVAFFHIGKCRMCGVKYNDDLSDTFAHLTNSTLQRKHDDYNHDDSKINGNLMVTDWDSFIKLLMEVQDFDAEWYLGHEKEDLSLETLDKIVRSHCKQMTQLVIDSAAKKFDENSVEENRPGAFQYIGMDFMMDDKGKFWFIEANHAPAIGMVGTPKIKDMTRIMLKEMVDIVMEIRERDLAGEVTNQETQLKSVSSWEPVELEYLQKTSSE